MLVVVGSENEPKRLAVEKAFGSAFLGEEMVVESVAAQSDVASHPITIEESIAGAENRARNAVRLRPGADYYVGIEGGLLPVRDVALEIGWVAIISSYNKIGIGSSLGIELRGRLRRAVESGEELSVALSRHHGLIDIGKANGYYGVTTNNLVTRESGYVPAIIAALAPFLHPEYFE